MKTLILQTSFLGDTILSTPVIAGVAELNPGSEIWMMTTPVSAALVCRDPLLSGVIEFDKRGKHRGISGLFRASRLLKRERFDKVYCLHRSYRSAILLWLAGIPHRVGFKDAKLQFLYHHSVSRPHEKHDVLRNLSILELSEKKQNQLAELRLSLEPNIKSRDDLSILKSTSEYVVLVPGSVWATKRWNSSGYRAVAEYYIALGFSVVVLGAKHEQEICRQVSAGLQQVQDLSGSTTISEMLAVIRFAKLVVCNDSMALHVASAFKVPTVAIFCATSPRFGFGPWRNRAAVVEKNDLVCKPCSPHGAKRCPTGTWSCCRELSAELVIAEAKHLS